tara:strand:+ start:1857 stop:8624 length:6768 start_codon:yes stop_codon:yes gene_type:complete
MALYQLTDRSGNKIQVEGPSGATKEQVVAIYNNTMAEREREPERRLRAGLENYYGTQREIAGQIARSRKPTFGDYLGEIPKGIIGGAAGLVETGALGLAALLPEDAENVVRDGIKKAGKAVQDYVPPDFNLEDSIPRKISEAGGSFAGIVGASLINPVAGATLAVSAGAGEASERARAAGATQEQRNLAALQGILPGALELIPAGRLVKGIKQVYRGEANPVELIKNRIQRASREGGIEAAQEVASGVAQNMIEQGYNPEQGTFEGSGESAGIGFTVGALAQSLLDLATPRTRGGASDVEPEETLALPAPDTGIAGLLPAPPKQLADQRKSLGNAQARADIGRIIDSTGDITLGEMEDIVARTGISLPDLETVVSEEMQKRGTKLAQRAQEEIEDELTTPEVERPPSRMDTAVADALAGRSAVQEAARRREEQAALERDDVAAYEQPDLLTAELEAARKISPEAAARDAARPAPPNVELDEQGKVREIKEEEVLPIQGPRRRDLVDLISEESALAKEIEAEETVKRQQEQTRAESVAETAQGKLDADRIAQTEATRVKVLQDTVANAGEVRRPEALRKLYENALTDAGLTNAKATPQEMESLRRASNVIRAKDPQAEAATAQEAVKDSRQLAMEARVAPKGIKPETITKSPLTMEDAGAPLAPLEGAADARPTDTATSGASVSPVGPSSAVGATPTAASTSDTTTLNQRGMGRPVSGTGGATVSEGAQSDTLKPTRKRTTVKAKPKPVTQKAEADTGPGTRKVKVTPTFPEKQTLTKVSKDLKRRGPAGSSVRGTRKLKPKQDTARADLRKRWEDTAPKVVKQDTAPTDTLVKDDVLSNSDNKKILNFLEGKVTTRDKIGLAAKRYLSMHPNPEEGLFVALFDMANRTPKFSGREKGMTDAQAELRKGTSDVQGARAVYWAMNNLSPQTQKWMDETKVEIQRQLDAVTGLDYAVRTESPLTIRQRIENAARAIKEREAVTVKTGVSLQTDVAVDAMPEGKYKPRKYKGKTSYEAFLMSQYTAEERKAIAKDDDLSLKAYADYEYLAKLDFALEKDAVVGLDVTPHPTVMQAIKRGDLKAALAALANTNGNAQVRELAAKFANVAGGTKLVTVKNLKAADGRPVAGLFDPKTNTISLDADTGINTHTLMHEMSHAGMSAALADPKNGFAIQLKKLFGDLEGLLSTAYGSKNPDEFLSEAMSNPEFRSELASINPKGEPVAALQRFFNIANNFLSRFVPFIKSRNLTALQEVDSLVDALLAPAPMYRYANQMAMMTTADGVRKFTRDAVDATQKAVNKESREQFKFSVRDFFTQGFSKKSKNLLLRLTGLQGLGDIAEAVGLGNMGYKLDELVAKQRGEIQTANKLIERKIGEILTKLNKGTTEQAQARKEALDRLIYDNDYGATIYQVDPTKSQGTYINKDGSPRMDNDGNDLLEVWKKQRADWKALGPEGQAVFNEMRAVYKGQYEKLRAVVMKQIDELVQNPDDAKKLKRDIFAKLFDASTLDVYFPLMREGDYVLRYEVKNPKSSREATVVQTFTTDAERQDAAKMFRANKDYKNVEVVDEVSANTFRGTGVDPSFAYDALSILDKNKVPQDVKDQIIKLFINSLPETSFAKSLQKRKGTPGYMQDSVYALKTKGYSLASQTAKLKYGALLRQYEADLDAFEQVALPKAKSFVGKRAERLTAAFGDVKAELKDRAQFARKGADNKDIEAIARRLNQTAFIYTIGFNASSALVNLSQIPLFVAPFLGGKHGYVKTYAAIKSAYGNTLLGGKRGGGTNSILDFYDISDKGTFTLKKGLKLPEGKEAELKRMEALVQTASQRGLLGQGFLAEAMGLNETSRIKKGGKIGNALDNASVLSAWLFNHAEQLNRQVTLMASFNLALDSVTDGKANKANEAQIEEAVNQAIYDTQQTNGGTFLETAPSIAREGIGRVAFMYKNYGLQMYYTMLKTAKTAMDSDKGKLDLFGEKGSPERKAAVKQLIGMHGSALFFAGVQGLPLYGAVKLIANVFFLDDEEEDFDTIVRQYMGEGWYKGAITEFAGLDVASRMALTGLLIQENRFNNNPSLEETIGFYAGGPALSVANRLYRGGSDLIAGETQRGIESILPAGLSNAYRATFGRYAQQGGIYTRRNDPIYDDLTNGDLVALTLGIRPTEYSFRTETSGALKNIDIAVNKKRSFLNKQYYVAMSMGDYEKMMDVYDDMIKFNERHPEAAITPDSIEDSMKRHAETTENMHYGRSFSTTYGDAIRDIRDRFKQ